MKRFKRRDWHKYKRLGQRHKRKVTWRRPNGIHSKTREKRRGYPASPSIGIKKAQIFEKRILISNLSELNLIKKGSKIIISQKVGNKKRGFIEARASELGVIISNKKMGVKK